jgi:hypothetical protein
MMVRRIALAAACSFGALAAADLAPDCRGVPGWEQKGEVRTFVPDNLFDYMNGNAEGYILYGFQKMTGVTCVSGGNQILIDFHEMESPEMAYGIFAANRHPRFEVRKIGVAGQVMPRRSTFAKGSYYVELAASGADDLSAPLEAFAKAIEPKVPGTSELPPALAWFPKDGLEDGSVRLVPQSVLGLRILKRGYIAKYDYGRAFIIPEATPESAAALMGQLQKRLGETATAKVAEEAFTGSDRYLGGMCVARKGRFVFGFAGLKEGEDGTARTATLAQSVQN